jgi:hypothetical protein
MTDKTPFEIVTDHCREQQKNACVRDLAYSIYRQQYESLTKDIDSDPKSIEAVQKTLLSPGNLVAHVRSAEDMLQKQFEEDLKPIRAKAAKDSFWISVISGIVGNILYSLLLIVIFIVAKDQLASWLSSLVQTQP